MTGFLGAGKTTLLRRLLEAPHGLRVGVILNERGQAGMDQAPAPDTDLVEIAEGCACCVRNPDLVEALRRMHARLLDDGFRSIADDLNQAWTQPRRVELTLNGRALTFEGYFQGIDQQGRLRINTVRDGPCLYDAAQVARLRELE